MPIALATQKLSFISNQFLNSEEKQLELYKEGYKRGFTLDDQIADLKIFLNIIGI